MGKLFVGFCLFGIAFTFSYAEMKCGAGKCGSSMQQNMNKVEIKQVYLHNIKYEPIDISPNSYSCAKCNMTIKEVGYSAQAVKKNGDTFFFDDIGCMILWVQKYKGSIKTMYVKTLDTHQWLAAQKAYYLRTESSPMHYGFGALQSNKKECISYKKVKEYLFKGKTMRNPATRKELLQK